VYGVRGTYDRVTGWGLYWGANFRYAQGPLKGSSPSTDNLCSTFSDKEAEGRFGYTFQWDFIHSLITPFIGVGYFDESNSLEHPCPSRLKFNIRYPYFAFGFLSRVNLFPCLTAGLNFKGWAMYDATCKVRDPEGEHCTMCVTDEINYRIELPVMYQTGLLNNQFNVGLVPFYEYRHYGGRANYPFDFLDTRLNIFGVNLQLLYFF
jgi:hypothetical protein